MQVILHYITIIPKIIIITAAALVHRGMIAFEASNYYGSSLPEISNVRVQYRAVRLTAFKELVALPNNTAILNTNPDHQALRQGSLSWSNPTPEVINGLENYIVDGVFIRGYLDNDLSKPNSTPAPSSMPISVAFGIVSGLRAGITINPSLRDKYLLAIDNLISKDMAIDSSSSVAPRLESVGYDATWTLGCIYTAFFLSGKQKYLDYANTILWKRGYAALLLAPLTWTTASHRDSFKDHVAIIGLWTAWQTCPSPTVRFLLKMAMKFVNSQSYEYTNPYWAALAHEMDALPESQRIKVLNVHAYANILKAAKYRSVIYSESTFPSDYSSHTSDEFSYDELHGTGVDNDSVVLKYVSLNGLCLGKSLAVLMNEEL